MKKILLFIISLALLLTFTSCMGANRKPYESYLYGKYPQTKLVNTRIIEELDKMLDKDKNDDGYFEFEGKEYAKIYATPRQDNYPAEDGSAILNGKYYYFRVDKISWRVLRTEGNIKYLISDNVLDACDYVNDFDSNNYQYNTSNIRHFLVDTFYNIAFKSETNKPLVTEIEIENSHNEKVKLNDSIWLPSVYDLDDKNNGFYSIDDKYAFSTDYATSQGVLLYIESPNAYFYRCSPYATSTMSYNYTNYMYYIDFYGKNALSQDNEILEKIGVRPCIRVEIKN